MIYSAKMVSDQLDAALTSAILNAEVINGALVVLGNLVGAVDKHNDVRVLLYRARLTKVGEDGLLSLSARYLTGKLRKRYNGYVKLLSYHL